jgi:hypothetical protein
MKGTIALIIVFVAVLVLLALNTQQWANATHRAQASIKAFCQRQELGLETKVHDPSHRDLHAEMTYRFLDEGASKLCLGAEIPLDETPARTCWIEHGDDACYAQLAAELLTLYRKREH